MRILVTGSNGLVGRAVSRLLPTSGHNVVPLLRQGRPGGRGLRWDPDRGQIESTQLHNLDAVIHLAGENIAGRWSEEKKRRIRDSRVKATRTLCQALARRPSPPRVLVAASGVNYYGDRGEELLTEDSPPGEGFLPEVCVEWEAATRPAIEAGIRVVNLRFGMVLSTEGGALPRMLKPFRLGLGGPFGSGRQFMSWITLDDAVSIIRFALDNEALQGPVNAVSPNPVPNREFARTLGAILHRPALFPFPGLAARAILGEMAEELLLSSVRAAPRRLEDTGYEFAWPDLRSALEAVLAQEKNV